MASVSSRIAPSGRATTGRKQLAPLASRRRVMAVLASAVFALVGSVLTVSPVAADPVGQVLVDGHAINGPGFNASDVTFANGVLSVTNPVGDPDDTITEIDGTVSSGSVSITSVSGTFDACSWSGTPQSFQCPTGIGIGPGSNISLQLTFSQPHSQGLSAVNVIFDFGLPPACADPSFSAQSAVTQRAAFLTSAQAVNCKPPGQTKLLSANINQRLRTASFHLSAHQATGYKCELLRDRRLMFLHTCSSTKTYGNPLPSGNYTFVAWGTDAGGLSAHPAIKTFTIAKR